jgi:hypothetical protein
VFSVINAGNHGAALMPRTQDLSAHIATEPAMKTSRLSRHGSSKRPLLALALALSAAAASAGPGTQTEDDVYVGRKAQGVTLPSSGAPQIKPGAGTSPNTGRSAATAATTTTSKTPMPGGVTPRTATPQPRPVAGTSPNTAAKPLKKTARDGGDDDLEDLEVERRTVQGVNRPGTTAPLPRPGAGTSPNTGRSAAPAPALLPGKP